MLFLKNPLTRLPKPSGIKRFLLTTKKRNVCGITFSTKCRTERSLTLPLEIMHYLRNLQIIQLSTSLKRALCIIYFEERYDHAIPYVFKLTFFKIILFVMSLCRF